MKKSQVRKLAEQVAKRLLENELKDLNTTQLNLFSVYLIDAIRTKSIMDKMKEIKQDRLKSGKTV